MSTSRREVRWRVLFSGQPSSCGAVACPGSCSGWRGGRYNFGVGTQQQPPCHRRTAAWRDMLVFFRGASTHGVALSFTEPTRRWTQRWAGTCRRDEALRWKSCQLSLVVYRPEHAQICRQAFAHPSSFTSTKLERAADLLSRNLSGPANPRERQRRASGTS